MSKYVVIIPIAGALEVTVEADDKNEAIDKAFEIADCSNHEQIYELETYPIICEGNVLHISTNEVYVKKLK